MKRAIIFLLFAPFSLWATDSTDISDECLVSMRNLYKFYYYQIQPNPNNESCKNTSETLNPSESAHMQVVISELKNHCPAELIAKVNFSLTNDTEQS